MNIVYAADERYAVYMGVSVTSLMASADEDDDLRIFVLGDGIAGETAAKLMSLGPVTLIDTRDFGVRLSGIAGGDADTGPLSAATYMRIYAGEYLPRDVERYIYLDCDTVVTGSLEGLYGTDLEGSVAAMAPEPTIYKALRDKLSLGEEEPYYNAGVMLVDRNAWERGGYTGLCSEYLRAHNGSIDFLDQDIINMVLRDRILALPQEYDFFSNYYYRSYHDLVKRSPWYARVMSEELYRRARSNPVIVHFAGDERPWYAASRNPYRDLYDKYLSLSLWAGTPPEKGHEVYMTLYHLMNLMTGYAPGIRDMISDIYFARR